MAKHTKETLEIACLNSVSIAGVCRALGIEPRGGNYKTIKKNLSEYCIDISHFTGQGWNVGENYRYFGIKKHLDEILVKNSTYTSSTSLKERLYKEGVLEEKCNCCGISEWNNKKISLELNHINGDNLDNRLLNLEILCPNCHSQTYNFRGRNLESKKNKLLKEKFVKSVSVIKPIRHCSQCNAELTDRQKSFCSYLCSGINKGKNVPEKDILINSFLKHRSYLGVGVDFGVSDNAVRKWVKKYNIGDEIDLRYQSNGGRPNGRGTVLEKQRP